MKAVAIVTSFLLLSSAAFAQSVGEKSGVNATLGVAPKSADFVTQVAISDMFEIESSKLASGRADASSKTFAARMIKDHTGTCSELKGIARKANFDVPGALDSVHQSKFDKLKGIQGADFDKEYDNMQVDAHKDAVDLFNRYAKGGDNAELKAFAAKHLPHLREHLAMAQKLGSTPSAKNK